MRTINRLRPRKSEISCMKYKKDLLIVQDWRSYLFHDLDVRYTFRNYESTSNRVWTGPLPRTPPSTLPARHLDRYAGTQRSSLLWSRAPIFILSVPTATIPREYSPTSFNNVGTVVLQVYNLVLNLICSKSEESCTWPLSLTITLVCWFWLTCLAELTFSKLNILESIVRIPNKQLCWCKAEASFTLCN